MRLPKSVYVNDTGGCQFGIDRVTPVTWHFTTRKVAPRSCWAGYGLQDADPAKLAAIAKPFYGSYYELRNALAKD